MILLFYILCFKLVSKSNLKPKSYKICQIELFCFESTKPIFPLYSDDCKVVERKIKVDV